MSCPTRCHQHFVNLFPDNQKNSGVSVPSLPGQRGKVKHGLTIEPSSKQVVLQNSDPRVDDLSGRRPLRPLRLTCPGGVRREKGHQEYLQPLIDDIWESHLANGKTPDCPCSDQPSVVWSCGFLKRSFWILTRSSIFHTLSRTRSTLG